MPKRESKTWQVLDITPETPEQLRAWVLQGSLTQDGKAFQRLRDLYNAGERGATWNEFVKHSYVVKQWFSKYGWSGSAYFKDMDGQGTWKVVGVHAIGLQGGNGFTAGVAYVHVYICSFDTNVV